MWKRIFERPKVQMVTTCLLCTLLVGSYAVVRRNLPGQESIQLEETQVVTAEDVPLESSEAAPFEVEAKGALLMDALTGEVLYSFHGHEELPLASVTKVMTMLLVMEAVEAGKISLEDQVTISERAASMGGSQMYMEPGELHTVAELMEGVAMASANDGCVALAEYVAGSEEIFVERMNAKASELGMRDTHFVNTNGLPVADHYSSAYDIAVMACKLYQYEETKKWFTTWQSTITVGLPGKEKEFGLTNTNKMIRQYTGCNGMKTGFTSEAGYCLVASANREETHLIAVVLGSETSKIRNQEVSKILDYGFANFETSVVAEEGQVLGQMGIQRGTPSAIRVIAGEKVTVLTEKGSEGQVTKKLRIDDNVKLPMKKGEVVGTLEVTKGEGVTVSYPVLAAEAVEKASFFELVERKIKGIWSKDI